LEEEEAGVDLEEEEEAAGLEVGLYDSTSDCGFRNDKDRGF
jgi:hypothetical protein